MRQMFHCDELPLSVCYRCAQNIVAQAKQYAPEIEPFESSGPGVVAQVETWTPSAFPQGSAVICRLNRPLVKLAFQLIKLGISMQYLGRDMSKEFKNLIKRHIKSANIETLLARLETERDQEIEKAEAKRNGKATYIEDKYDSLISIVGQCTNVSEVSPAIEKLFQANPGASVTLCTVHKSKGLEWPVVFLLDSARYMPHPRALEGWQLQQEYNILYVAVTRAKRELYFIES